MGSLPSCCIKSKEPFQSSHGFDHSIDSTLPIKKKVGFYEIILTPITTPQTLSGAESRPEMDPEPVEQVNQNNIHILVEDENEGDLTPQLTSFNKNRKISLKDFKLIYTLGKGAFCHVFLGEFKEGKQGRLYAIKQMKKLEVKKKKLIENIKLEKSILKASKCNFITSMHYAFRDEDFYYLVMEWAEGGDLYSFIKPGTKRRMVFKKIGEIAIRFILACIILSLEHLHDSNIIYSDLKPENVLVFDDGYCKLTDFGVSKKFQRDSNTFKTGTRMYFAPEMVIGAQCKRHVDLWALGVVAYELANLFLPFQLEDIGDKEKFQDVIIQSEKKRIWVSRYISEELKDFVNRLLKLQPRERLGSSGWKSIKNHSFFQKYQFDWQKLEKRQMTSPLLPILKEKLTFTKVKEAEIHNFQLLEWQERQKYETIPDWSSQNSNFQP